MPMTDAENTRGEHSPHQAMRSAKSRPLKSRLDLLLVERGLAASRERARALILAGRVLVNEQKIAKAGTAVAGDATVRLLGEDQPYVSRGGVNWPRPSIIGRSASRAALASTSGPPPAASPIACSSTARRASPPSIPALDRST
jgi:ribosomal 50S subunit-recycling heat shock protein